ncbi:MAG: hypothetical protein QF921_14065 [Pseudomonadales bacterium]|nr:hypothetical protein [Pseudomonadales bacterium]MDP6470131.1 hypothetical protein [Pseudomonadales bacterium]MDP6827037.1 hypothetical protein [Pseudomonadales bacterium]MDP6972606.1 hypothetical protein [Pseudomonadales bacterium]|tara:strand:+ start:735 stop:995 length:261 start_codon:yes stop_codon:yes gene_type:complete
MELDTTSDDVVLTINHALKQTLKIEAYVCLVAVRIPGKRKTFVGLKQQLARKHKGRTQRSRERYSMAKTGFICSVIESALASRYEA